MKKVKEIRELSLDCGFTHAGALDPRTLKFLTEVRDMCNADKCNSYGRSWACPPGCGSLEEMEERCAAYDRGVIVQTVGEMEDDFDIDTMIGTQERHKESFDRLKDELMESGGDFWPMGAGTCTICEKCSYPDEPCRFPDKCFPSMEACGLQVSDVCKDNGIDYYYGRGTICYVSCVLF